MVAAVPPAREQSRQQTNTRTRAPCAVYGPYPDHVGDAVGAPAHDVM